MSRLQIIFKKLKRLFCEGDVRYFLYEKYALFQGSISIQIRKWIYQKRLVIQPPFRVWGRIRFLIHGPGPIVINHCPRLPADGVVCRRGGGGSRADRCREPASGQVRSLDGSVLAGNVGARCRGSGGW